MMPYLKLFGGAVLENEGGVIDGSASRRYPLAILALLATASSRTLSRGKLVGLLWPDSPEERGRSRLNTYVYRIRNELGRDVLVSLGDDLRLNERALDCDVFGFEAALRAGEYHAAAELYGGPFLDGFELGDSALFQRHVEGERSRLRLAYLKALEGLAERAEERGDEESAVRWWRTYANEDSYDSSVVGRLMEALARTGNPAGALRAARVHARFLEQEFGTGPSSELQALVEELKTAPGPRNLASQDGSASEPMTAPVGSRTPEGALSGRGPARARLMTALAFVGLLGAGATGGWYLLGAGGTSSSATSGRAIAVLPFENLAGEVTRPLTDGLHSELSTRLAGVRGLEVVSRGSVLRFRDTELSPREIARELGATWVLRGEMLRSANEVQLNVRLVEASRDRQVWAESYRRAWTAENLFEIQSEVTRSIVRALRVALSPEEQERLAAVPTENTAAYELYLQARQLDHLHRAEPPRSTRPGRKVELYRRALELDPDFADALAGLADAYLEIAWARDDRDVWLDSAVAVARKALEIDPELAGAHVQLADVHFTLGRTEEAIAAYGRALELDPSDVEAMNNLIVVLQMRGRFAQAMRWLDRMQRISPGSGFPIGHLFRLNGVLGRDGVADGWLRRGRERGHSLVRDEFIVALGRGDLQMAREIWREEKQGEAEHTAIRGRAALALYEGDWQEARRHYRALYPGVSWGPEPLFRGLLWDPLGLAHALDRLGDRESALEIATEVAGETGAALDAIEGDWIVHHRMAVSQLILGDTTAALDWLETAVDAGYRFTREMRGAPTLAPLREHSGFQALLDRMEILLAEERRRVEAEGWGLPPG